MGLARQGSPLDWRSDHSAVAGTRLVDDPYGTATGPVSTLCRAFRTWVRFSGAHYAAPVVAIVQSDPGATCRAQALGADERAHRPRPALYVHVRRIAYRLDGGYDFPRPHDQGFFPNLNPTHHYIGS